MTTGLALAFGVGMVQAPSANALSGSEQQKFIDSVVPAAQSAQKKFGVPASVLIAQAIAASEWGQSAPATKAKNYFDTPCVTKMSAGEFGALARDQIGKPYVLGAEASISNPNPAKFDCSELVEWLYGRSGNKITDLAASQYKATNPVTGSPKVGDLVFLRNNPARFNGIGHVAILTKKQSNGDWEIVEARGRAYGVVKTTLSYWKSRSYYAGLRRQSAFALGNSSNSSAAGNYKAGCTTIDSKNYSTFSSITNSFYGNAAAIKNDSGYAKARKVLSDIPQLVNALAEVVAPKNSSDYASKLNSLIADHGLRNYDVVPMSRVLLSGATGSKVTSLQYLLKANGQSTAVNGKYDKGTVAAVKAFQKSKSLESDGEAGPNTLTAIFKTVKPGASGDRVQALTTLLTDVGYSVGGGSYNSSVTDAVKAFQTAAGRVATGTADVNTWAALFMSVDSSTPTISGTAKVDSTLTAAAGTWGPGSVKLSYQWFRGDSAISGATGTSYQVQPADVGQPIKVAVTGQRSGYTRAARVSKSTESVVPLNFTSTPEPTISGTPATGQTLSATIGTWSPEATSYGYQWLRDGNAISGATGATYVVDTADQGAGLTVAVTGNRDGYQSVTVTSGKVNVPVPPKLKDFTKTYQPKISGTPVPGQTLKVIRGTWQPSPDGYRIQWYRGSDKISGATGKTYRVTSKDLGQKISVAVTGSKSGYNDVTKTSASVAVAKTASFAKTYQPKITGKAKVGKSLSVTRGVWQPGGITFKYQWYRGSTKISGATSKSYRVTSTDKGKKLKVRITASKRLYQTVVRYSKAVKVS